MLRAPSNALSDRTTLAIRERLAGKPMGRLATAMLFAGPAVVASIAYMDPGNFATNVQAGAAYGYSLLWVVLSANIVAMLFQALSAKLGIVTGLSLAEHSREQFPAPVVWAMWGISEVAAMATDLAEFVGGAIGFSLLLHVPLMVGMLAVGLITYAILQLDRGGFRPMELVIGGLVAVIGVCYLAEMFIAPVDWRAAALGSVTPRLVDARALTIAVGVIGATVMPHAIYLHSALAQVRVTPRDDTERATLVRFLQPRGFDRVERGGSCQHGDGGDVGRRVSCGPPRRRRDRDRVPHPDAAAGGRRRRFVFAIPAGLRRLQFGRRHPGRAGHHARLFAVHGSGLGAPTGHGGRLRSSSWRWAPTSPTRS